MFRSTRTAPLLFKLSCITLLVSLSYGLPQPSVAQVNSALPPRSLLQMGAQGNDVRELQGILNLMGLYEGAIDGQFSEATLVAVTRFQKLAGLVEDGIVGAATWRKLLPPAPGETPVTVIVPSVPGSDSSSNGSPAVPPISSRPSEREVLEPILRKGAEGPAVSRLQRRLQARGFYEGPIDGGFGEVTEAAVKAAQRRAGLEEDGIVGPATWAALR